MSSRHGIVVQITAGAFFLMLAASHLAAQTGAGPALTSPPPQQMPVYGSSANPANYPSTYPSTANYPAANPTAYPPTSSYPSTLPSTRPSSYQSTSVPDPVVTPSSGAAPPFEPLNLNTLGAATEPPLYKPYGSPDAMTDAFYAPPQGAVERAMTTDEPWSWQLLPTGLMYRSYLAGNKEPRLGSQLVHDRYLGWLWDATVGGRAGIIRFGTENDLWPQGYQLDIEGAAFPRLDLQHNEDLQDVDFRGGILMTTRQGRWEGKFGFYHLSSHLGDEYMIRVPSYNRRNYVRDSLVAGVAYNLNPSMRLYSEVGWCFHEDGGARPWEFQFGVDWSSLDPTGVFGSPFFAINGHLRQENDFGGNMTVQTGWQWRGRTGHLFRLGMQYFNGMSDQYQFYNTFEEQIGFGIWYDF